jgi:hypothetical protein
MDRHYIVIRSRGAYWFASRTLIVLVQQMPGLNIQYSLLLSLPPDPNQREKNQ